MASDARIWFDLTTLSTWRRPVVGVVRAEREVARWLSTATGVRFCSYDRDTHSFSVLTSDQVTEALEEREDRVALANDLDTVPGPLLRARRALVQSWAEVELHSRRALRSFVHPVEVSGPKAPHVRAPFARGDVLVSMGLDWRDKDLRDWMTLRARHGVRTLSFCYDLIPVLFPHLCAGDVAPLFTKYFCDLAHAADHVLCISKSSQTDLRQLWAEAGAPATRTSVVRLGCDLPVEPRPSSVAQPFILYVSTVERRKNHDVLYKAYARLVETRRTAQLPLLVCVGMKGWGVNDLLDDLRRDPRVRDRIVLLHEVDDAELADLYRRCLFTVYPSLYEGWGLPVAESLLHGKYCLASTAASIPEIAGELLQYLDPLDVNAWADAIVELSESPLVLHHREREIRAKFVAPTWADAAKKVHAAARRLAS